MIEANTGIANGVKFIGEIAIPGASQFIDGKIGSGIAHFLVAGAAALVLAPSAPALAAIAAIGVRLNSFSGAVNNQTIADQVARFTSSGSSPANTATLAPVAAVAPVVEGNNKKS